ncbi:SpoIID/LytB domain-containing protein [Rhodohalobacter sp.]|uniref:SpoIID/LytB domain-containing protein n=1 Tax=Rhodohalobacter sp. TaxID=1974210 RepID=UPI002ACEDCDD|nr:SpoIID/LytB domain-containing protein [Rhodohalobacter sp.]MDZ7757004.1 SpoIID/LytB domain-containing protein [Rhodohalobacter sp.]
MTQHYFTLLYLLLIGLPFFDTFIESTLNHPENYLDLTETGTVRVLILEKENPNVIRINAKDAPLSFQLDEREITLKPGDGFVFVYLGTDGVTFKKGGISEQSKKLTIHNQGGLIQLFSQETSTRYYRGDLEIEFRDRAGLQMINAVGLEDYVTSVIGSEMNFREMDALKSQAVVSRTYTLWSMHKSAWPGFHLKDHEQNQVYKGELISRPDYAEAAQATAGEILTWSNKLILAAYSSTCGGTTGNNSEMWTGPDLPYLNPINDRQMCSLSPHYEWETELSTKDFFDFIKARYAFTPVDFDIQTHPSGRVSTITFYDRFSKELTFAGNEFRLIINRHFDNMTLKSTLFTVHQNGSRIHISGNGLGHGVGMCQWGAKGFANAGWNYSDILSFYFSGTKIVDLNDIEEQKIALSN